MPAASTIRRANAILDGVVSISEHEMLIHGTYIARHIARPDLASQGAVCGGRQACLIGSVALAATPNFLKADKVVDAIRVPIAYGPMPPAVRLVVEALNDEATVRLEAEGPRSKKAREALNEWDQNPAEGYFESFLSGASKAKTHIAIVDLVEGARRRLPEPTDR